MALTCPARQPQLSCGCLAGWMVQPIIVTLLGLGFPN